MWTRKTKCRGGSYRPAVRYRFKAALDGSGNPSAINCRVLASMRATVPGKIIFRRALLIICLLRTWNMFRRSPPVHGGHRSLISLPLQNRHFGRGGHGCRQRPGAIQARPVCKGQTKTGRRHQVQYRPHGDCNKTAAEKSGWGTKKDVAQGFSVYFSHQSYVAQVCEAVMEKGKPAVKKNLCGIRLRASHQPKRCTPPGDGCDR